MEAGGGIKRGLAAEPGVNCLRECRAARTDGQGLLSLPFSHSFFHSLNVFLCCRNNMTKTDSNDRECIQTSIYVTICPGDHVSI